MPRIAKAAGQVTAHAGDDPTGWAATALNVRHLSKRFGDNLVVDDVSLAVQPGHILALLGPSGCGKTTTLRLIAGFETVDDGRIEVAGQTVADARVHIPPERRRTGMVFQDYALFPHLTVGQNIGFALGRGAGSQTRVAELLDFVGLPGYAAKMPHQLSGGEQQRVSLARALSLDPAVLLLDEPFSNLDAARRDSVRAEVRTMLKARAITAVFVTHDQEEALFLGDEVAVMMDGRLEQIGSPEAIYHQPCSRRVAEFIGQTRFLPGEAAAGGIVTSLDTLARSHGLPSGTAVEVALRPDDITLTPDDEGNGRVVARQFVGIAYIYTVRLADGTELDCWQPHIVNLPQGAGVRVELADGHEPAVFWSEEAI
jgi:iron(III) transport system ATP-binding protein